MLVNTVCIHQFWVCEYLFNIFSPLISFFIGSYETKSYKFRRLQTFESANIMLRSWNRIQYISLCSITHAKRLQKILIETIQPATTLLHCADHIVLRRISFALYLQKLFYIFSWHWKVNTKGQNELNVYIIILPGLYVYLCINGLLLHCEGSFQIKKIFIMQAWSWSVTGKAQL